MHAGLTWKYCSELFRFTCRGFSDAVTYKKIRNYENDSLHDAIGYICLSHFLPDSKTNYIILQ